MTAPNLTASVREQLDAATYDALSLAVKAKVDAAERAGYDRAMKERSGVLLLADTLRGLTRSWTAGAGALLIAMPDILPMLQADLPALLGPGAANTVMRICGVLMIALRIKTKVSVWAKARQSEKGAKS